ncbi:unnamed protein product [Mycena citricolor]|uniref:Uncharacterized protein n=1 Tax=Mycena citricolor TaxID=2018698 RepID=A0AAD2JY09_9AGAR|nr:unnamed protein product [Mycena citricolor]
MSVTELKAEGNALFNAKNFAAAEAKYAAAILASEQDSDDKTRAVLHANRAACRLSLKRRAWRYMDAVDDATRATHLDPTYAKAFGRLASAKVAMGDHTASQTSWLGALDALPKSGLTPSETTQKLQYEAGLKAAIKAAALSQTYDARAHLVAQNDAGSFPWTVASQMIPRLRAQARMNPDVLASSVCLLPPRAAISLLTIIWRPGSSTTRMRRVGSAAARSFVGLIFSQEFAEGVGKMNFMRPYEASDNAGVAGMLGALAAMSNGIMRDERVMHISDPQFLVKFNKQVIFEANAVRAWTHEGPELVIQKALERQERDGWRSVRHALAVTVRAWMMRALMEGGLRAQHTVSVDFYKNCLLVIRTLRDKWSSSSKDDRGVIFEKTFEFGIAKMYLEAIMQAYNPNTAPEMLDLLQTEADRLIREIEEFMALPKPQEPLDPGFMSSFCLYPKGQAYSMRGFLQVQLIRLHPEDAREYQAKAAPEYLKAAACFPPDDEKHAWFLKVALSNQESSGKFTVREILDTMQRIAESAPKAKAIWERSALGMGGAWEALAGVAKQEAHLRQLVAQGKFSMDSCVSVE